MTGQRGDYACLPAGRNLFKIIFDMNNREIAEIFERIADLLEIKGEIIYKTLATACSGAHRLQTSEVAGLSQKDSRNPRRWPSDRRKNRGQLSTGR